MKLILHRPGDILSWCSGKYLVIKIEDLYTTIKNNSFTLNYPNSLFYPSFLEKTGYKI